MSFISEDIINEIVEGFSMKSIEFEKLLASFSEDQPFLFAFLMSEGFDVLEDNEKDLLLFIAMVIYASFDQEVDAIPLVSAESIQEFDEDHWTSIDGKKLKTFKDIADFLFQNYSQEDLLAFVEDTLVEDDEEELSQIGRKVIFVSMRSFIDAINKALENSVGA